MANIPSTQYESNTIKAGDILTERQGLISSNGEYYLRVQAEDGNVCIYTKGHVFVWGTMVTKGKGSYLTLQTDGNLVVYDAKNQAVWSSQTQGYYDRKFLTREWKPTRAVLEDDGTLCLYNAENKKVWNSPFNLPSPVNVEKPAEPKVSVHSTTVSRDNEIMSISPGPEYAAKFGDVIEVSTYSPQETQSSRYPAGLTYNIFMVSQGPTRTPQSFFYFSTDKGYWQDALREVGSFIINGLGVGVPNVFQAGDKYTITAIQYEENGPIELDLVFTRNGEKVGVIFGDTKPMKWPGD